MASPVTTVPVYRATPYGAMHLQVTVHVVLDGWVQLVPSNAQ